MYNLYNYSITCDYNIPQHTFSRTISLWSSKWLHCCPPHPSKKYTNKQTNTALTWWHRRSDQQHRVKRLKAPPTFDSTHPTVRLIYLIGFYCPSQTASCDLLNDLNRVFLFSICLLAWWRESGQKNERVERRRRGEMNGSPFASFVSTFSSSPFQWERSPVWFLQSSFPASILL